MVLLMKTIGEKRMSNKRYFPMFVDLSDKKIIIVGGGQIATRRVHTFLQFTRNILVISPDMTSELIELCNAGIVQYRHRKVKRSDLTNAYIVVAATNDRRVNDDIYRICKEEGIYVNVSSDRDKCDFYFPGIVMQDSMVVGITASGLSHKKARQLCEGISNTISDIAEKWED